jgi:hypothetical protein
VGFRLIVQEFSRLTEPEVSENDQYDDYDPDDVEDVHAVLLAS